MKLRVTVITVIIILSVFGMMNRGYAQKEVNTSTSNSEVTAEVSSRSDVEAVEYINTDIPVMPSFIGMVAKGIFSLVIVFGLIFGFVLFLRKFVYNRNGSGLSNGLVKIISTTFIAPKKSIHLIKVMDRILVVGVTENQIQSLAEFNEEEIPEYINETRKINTSGRQFSSYINMFFDKMRKKDLQEDK